MFLGALFGGLVGMALGVFGAVVVAMATGKQVTWKTIAAGAIGGFVGGAITGATLGFGSAAGEAAGGSIAATLLEETTLSAAANGAGRATSSVVGDVLDGKPLDVVASDSAIGFGEGALMGGIARPATRVLAGVVGPIVKFVLGGIVGRLGGLASTGETEPVWAVSPGGSPVFGGVIRAPLPPLNEPFEGGP